MAFPTLDELHRSKEYLDASNDSGLQDVMDTVWFEEATRITRIDEPDFNPGILIQEARDAGLLHKGAIATGVEAIGQTVAELAEGVKAPVQAFRKSVALAPPPSPPSPGRTG